MRKHTIILISYKQFTNRTTTVKRCIQTICGGRLLTIVVYIHTWRDDLSKLQVRTKPVPKNTGHRDS